ncbi:MULTISPECIES: lipopolysaccharide biosynthesis protein [Plesiomonas]|nr:oligosaccharide flippase family protein [Plesiomonas shigelloides]KAB7684929.1 oligosaccharide flippase family protein [Plesiomonas shigelloides]KAB7690945.1 oligosaccharide flippase family protein [Plesiomonas shigelloides]MCE5164956.1 oligosaccharide flippase family protein [Plesiomonas sp. PI-19]MCQ8858401.1 oligosaccharide flippase family protein [Plesiomonas shigelloides]
MRAYWTQVSVVFSGALMAQVIPIFGTLFITRLYSPSEFGVYSLWLSVASTLSVFLTLRFEGALAIENEGDERQIAIVGILVSSLVCSLTLIAVLVFINAIHLNFLFKYSRVFLWTVIPGSFLLALNTVWQIWLAVDGEYNKLNVIRLFSASLIVIFQILMGITIPNSNSLLISHISGLFISFVILLKIKPLSTKVDKAYWYKVRYFFYKRKKFPIYSLPADFINTFSSQLPVLIVTSRFGAEIGGILALTMRILGAPIGILGKAVLDVFRRHAAMEYSQTGSCKKIYLKTMNILSIGAFFFVLGVVFFAEKFFTLAFGHEWTLAGTFAIWLLPMFGLRFIASPLSYTLYITEKLHMDLIWQTILFVVTFIPIYYFSGYENAIVYYGVSYSVMYVFYLIITYRAAG